MFLWGVSGRNSYPSGPILRCVFLRGVSGQDSYPTGLILGSVFLWGASGRNSYPPGPILESAFLWCVSVDRATHKWPFAWVPEGRRICVASSPPPPPPSPAGNRARSEKSCGRKALNQSARLAGFSPLVCPKYSESLPGAFLLISTLQGLVLISDNTALPNARINSRPSRDLLPVYFLTVPLCGIR